MESAQHRARHDRATRRRVIGQPPLARDALADRLVRTASVEVSHPFGQYPPQVILAEDQHVVEALSAEAAEEALAAGIQVGRFRQDRDTSMPAPSAAPASLAAVRAGRRTCLMRSPTRWTWRPTMLATDQTKRVSTDLLPRRRVASVAPGLRAASRRRRQSLTCYSPNLIVAGG